MATNENLIPIPGRLHSVATEGHVAGADEIFDDSLQKNQATINSEVNAAIGTGGSVDSRIAAAVNALDSSKSQSAGADGLALSVVEENGKITSISGSIAANTYDSYGSASAAQSAAATDATTKVNAAKAEIKGNATSACDTLGEAEALISAEKTRAQAAEAQLNAYIQALSKSQPVPKTAEEWAAMTSWEEGVIYRVQGTTSYADWMYNGTTTIKMAEFDNAIDDVPTAGSDNLVKSGGVYGNTLHKSIVGDYSENMIDGDVVWTDGQYANTISKQNASHSTLSVTSKIPVIAGKTYVFPCYGNTIENGMFCRITDANGNYVVDSMTPPYFNNISLSPNNVITLTIPEGGVFIEINYFTANKSSCYLKELYTTSSKKNIDWLSVNADNLDDELHNSVFDIKGTQINGNPVVFSSEDITLDSYTTEGYKSQNNFVISENSSQAIHSAIIPVREGDVYKVFNGQEVSEALYKNYFIFAVDETTGAISSDKIGDYIEHAVEDGNHVYYVTIPRDCVIFYLTIADAKRNQSYVKKVVNQNELKWLKVTSKNLDEELAKSISNNRYYLQDSIKKPIVFADKKMFAFGDSITAGTCSPNLGNAGDDSYIKKFMSYVEVNASSQVRAIGGSCIADTAAYDEQYNIVKMVKQYANSSVDIIWIAGGTNDWNSGRPLGNFYSSDTATFYGALKNLCEWLQTNCPNAIIIFVTPIPYTKSASLYPNHVADLDAYRSAIYEVATSYGYNVVDGNSLGMPKEPGGWNNYMCADSDGCHPTVEGHKLMARNLCTKLL